MRTRGRPNTCVLLLVACIVSFVCVSPVLGQATTGTGFYYPLGRSTWSHGCAGWLARDSDHEGCYFSGYYHIGEDMMASVGDNVYLIAKGKITYTSSNGWGSGNVGLAVLHKLSDGTEFMALYGHVRNVQIPSNVEYPAGTVLAKIGPYDYGDHLHFGIRPGNSMPASNWGMMPNSSWPSTNGFENPINWIETKVPEGGSGCTPDSNNIWLDFGWGGPYTGCQQSPFNDMSAAINALNAGGILHIKPGSSSWTGTISKPMTLQAEGGTVTIGN